VWKAGVSGLFALRLSLAFSLLPQTTHLYTVDIMPDRGTKLTFGSRLAAAPRRSFRQQYDDLEARRAKLCERLRALGHKAEGHAAYKGALRLLNNVYRREKLAQRLAVLQSAGWLIDILEKLTNTL
jgi:hypothetical protein